MITDGFVFSEDLQAVMKTMYWKGTETSGAADWEDVAGAQEADGCLGAQWDSEDGEETDCRAIQETKASAIDLGCWQWGTGRY